VPGRDVAPLPVIPGALVVVQLVVGADIPDHRRGIGPSLIHATREAIFRVLGDHVVTRN
jgi:hypothetical protein